MAKINRPNTNVKAFASEALAGERTIFDDSTSSDDLAQNLNPSFARGFGVFGPSEFPTLEDFNGFGYTATQLVSYLYQQGVPEWTQAQTYYKNSLASVDGRIFVSSQNDNTGNNPAQGISQDYTNWEESNQISTPVLSSSKITKINDIGYHAKVNTDNTITIFSEKVLISDNETVVVLDEEFSDTINMIQTGAMYITRLSEDRIAVMTQSEIGVYDIDTDALTVNQVGSKLPLSLVTATDYDIVGLSIAPTTTNHMAVYNGDNGNIRIYSFDGSAFTDEGVKYSGLSGRIQLAKTLFDGSDLVAYSNSVQEIYKLSYNGTSFDLDGTTSTAGFDSFNTISSGELNTIIAYNVGGASARVLSTSGSSIFELGVAVDTSPNLITDAILTGENLLVISDAEDAVSLYVSSNGEAAGNSFWRLLSAQGIGFDGSGTNIMSNNVQDAIKEVAKEFIYPVGGLWINRVDERNPSEILGFGSWIKVEGRFLAGDSSLDNDFNAGTTGGSKNHSHEVEGDTQNATVTTTIPRDGWGALQSGGKLPEPTTSGRLVTGSGDTETSEALESLAHASGDRDIDAQPHSHTIDTSTDTQSNLPPYEVYYVWRRIS